MKATPVAQSSPMLPNTIACTVDRRAPVGRDLVQAPVGDGALVHPRAEHRADGAPKLLLRILRKGLAQLAPDDVLIGLYHLAPILGLQFGVERRADVELGRLEHVLEMMVIDAQDDLAVHLDEAAIAVPGKARIAALLGEPVDRAVVEAEIEDRVHHARHRRARARAHRDKQRIVLGAEAQPDPLLELRQGGIDLLLQVVGIGLVVGVIEGADPGGDGEARRHGKAQIAHLGEIGALAAEQVLHLGAALGAAVAKAVDPFRHRPPTLRSARSRRPR